MSIFVSKQILWAPGDWQCRSLPVTSLTVPLRWLQDNTLDQEEGLVSNIAHLLQRFLMPFYHQGTTASQRAWAAFTWWWWETLYLTITMADKHCLSVTETAPSKTSFLGPYAMSKAVILFFLLPYLGLHTCHLPLKRAKDFLYPPNVFIVSVQINCIGIWFTHSKMALFVKLVYSSIHFAKSIPRYVLPNEDIIATSLSLKNYWCILFV